MSTDLAQVFGVFEPRRGGLMSGTDRFVFPPNVDVKCVAQVRTDLMQTLNGAQALELDLSGVEEADVSFIQLILALRRSAAERNASLTLASPAPNPVIKMLERGGFIGAAPDDRRNFWLAA